MNAPLSLSRRKNPRDPVMPIDWGSLHRRLKAAQLSTENAATINQQRRDLILAQRARRAAVPPAAQVPSGGAGMVVFEISQKRFGLEGRFVREVVNGPRRAPLPGTPECVDGLISLRGEIVVVVDLRKVLGLSETLAAPSVVVILRQNAVQFGILADALVGTAAFDQAHLKPLDLGGTPAVQRELICGLAPGSVAVLNGHQLFAGKWASHLEPENLK